MVKRLPTMQETWVPSLGREDFLEKKMQPTPVFLPGESHGWRSMVDYSPWGCKESDTTEQLHFHFLCLDICPGVGLLDHMAILFLVVWGTSILFSVAAAPIYFPTNSVGGKNHILKTFTLVDKCLLIPQLYGLQVPPFPYNFLPCWDKLGVA